MDTADRADIEIDNYNRSIIAKNVSKKYTKLKPEGYCHNCLEDLEENQLFCNSNCAKQHDYTEKLRG